MRGRAYSARYRAFEAMAGRWDSVNLRNEFELAEDRCLKIEFDDSHRFAESKPCLSTYFLRHSKMSSL